MKESKEEETDKAKPLDALMQRVLVFVDRNGEVVQKESSPMHSALEMKYRSRGGKLVIKMHVAAYAQGNGSCSAIVKHNGKTVFNGGGCYTAGPWDVEATTFKKGVWEKM